MDEGNVEPVPVPVPVAEQKVKHLDLSEVIKAYLESNTMVMEVLLSMFVRLTELEKK